MARILLAAPTEHGHLTQLLILARELVARKHLVTLATGGLIEKIATEMGATFFPWEYKASSADAGIEEREQELRKLISSCCGSLRIHKLVADFEAEIYPSLYERACTLFRESTFDAVVADYKAYALIDRARHGGIPVVVLSRFFGDSLRTELRYPQFPLPFFLPMKAKERLLNTLHPIWWRILMGAPRRKMTRQRKMCAVRHGFSARCGDERDVMRVISGPLGFEFPRKLPFTFKIVAPVVPKELPPIPAPLVAWIHSDSTENPIVFISFGTVVPLPPHVAAALVKSLESAPVRVLWSLPKDQHSILPYVPSNFRIEEYVPQLSVLADSKVRLFVTHCGMNGISEAIVCGKPMLALPVFFDQPYNAARIVDLGIGLRVLASEVNVTAIFESIKILLSDKRFTMKAVELSRLQQRCCGRDNLLRIIEEVAEVGYDHLLVKWWDRQSFR